MSKILVVVDVQKDFYHPNGNLYVPGGEEIIPEIAKIIPDFDLVLFTADWHPYNHCSFIENGGQWPKHCIAFTEGASIPIELTSKVKGFNTSNVIVKGTLPNVEEYGSDKICNKLFLYNCTSICFVGLAGDFCVKNTIQKVLNDSYLNKVNLKVYSPGIKSIDGGEALNEFIIENNIKEYVHK